MITVIMASCKKDHQNTGATQTHQYYLTSFSIDKEYRADFIWDQTRKLTTTNMYDADGQLTNSMSYYYNSNNQIVRMEEKEDTGSISAYITYEYADTIMTCRYFLPSSGQFKETDKFIYHLNSKGLPSWMQDYTNPAAYTLSETQYYKYDQNGNAIQEDSYDAQGKHYSWGYISYDTKNSMFAHFPKALPNFFIELMPNNMLQYNRTEDGDQSSTSYSYTYNADGYPVGGTSNGAQMTITYMVK